MFKSTNLSQEKVQKLILFRKEIITHLKLVLAAVGARLSRIGSWFWYSSSWLRFWVFLPNIILYFGSNIVPLKLVGNEQWSLISSPNPDGSTTEHGSKMGLFELLNDLIMMSYLTPFQSDIWKLMRGKSG